MSLDNTTSNEDFDLQYVITFEHDNHGELIIDRELVKATDNPINEQEHVEELEGGTNRGVSVGRRSRGRGRGVGRGRGRGKSKGKGNDEHLNSEFILLELPTFNPIPNNHPLHRGYVTLPHEYQLGIVTPLSLFQLFFTNEQLRLMVENTNIYE